jgi:diacylglycerol kinase (ATP)
MIAKVILNPYAGRWKALENRPLVENELRSAGIEYDLTLTEGPLHGTRLAEQYVEQGYKLIIAAGGDGSISEVINGVAHAALKTGTTPPTVGILPLGSANDFVVNLGLPQNIPEAIQVIRNGQYRCIDLGQVITHDADEKNRQERFFDNNSAIGLEPSVTLIQQRIKRLRGTPRYLVATLLAIMQKPQWTIQMEWEGGSYQGCATLVTVGNNPLTGGLFYMTPHADPFDGKLTYVYGYLPTRLKILKVLPQTMKAGVGSYIENPAIHEGHTTWIRILTNPPTPVHSDGEIISSQACTIEYHIMPNYLPVCMPKG